MPELPEVETIVRQLRKIAAGRKLKTIRILDPKLPAGKVFSVLEGQYITGISRRGKFIILNFSNNQKLIFHLRMTGRLLCQDKKAPMTKQARAFLQLDRSGSKNEEPHPEIIVLEDLRRFATMHLGNCNRLLDKLGVEPLTSSYNIKYLRPILAGKRLCIKDLLLDQNKIAGIGNIYASEILFASRIKPQRIASSLKPAEIVQLIKTTKQILRLAIRYRGTTFSDYRDTEKRPGRFQNLLKIYNREALPCMLCHRPVKKINQRGRSSYYCSHCQK